MSAGQRRLAAIVFTDLVGYSALTQRDEAKALRLLEEHRTIVRPVIAAHLGREVKTIGDAFLIEFDSALDATECAVDIQRKHFEHNRKPDADRIEMRIGIHVGDVVHAENDVYGDAVNIASRIEPLAEAGGVCVTGPVYEQVHNKLAYTWVAVERAFLKNIEFPVSVYAIELPWKAPRTGGVTPFINRTAELDLALPLLKTVAKGEGAVLAFSGEGGIGKTRLADEVIQRAERAGFRALRGHGYGGEVATPYAHWSEVVRAFAKDAPNPLLYKVCADCSGEIVQLVPELLQRLGPGPPREPVPPEQAQLRFFDGIARFFANLAAEMPLVLLLDDLQWADTASLRLLASIARGLAESPLLLLLTFREVEARENPVLLEVLDELDRAHRLARRSLKRFDAKTSAELVDRMLTPGSGPQPPGEFARTLFEKTGGNPFFLEAVVQTLISDGALVWAEEGWAPRPGLEIRLPPSVQSVIRQRLKNLDEATVSALRNASVLGSQFTFQALERMTDVPDETLLEMLERGLQAHLLEERSEPSGRPVYAFADFQIRDALYEEISLVRRARLHLKAGEVLEALASPEHAAASGDLARHFLLGQDPERAFQYALRAADEAGRFFAREEAIRYYTTAQELLELRPDSARRSEVLERMADQLSLLGRPAEALKLQRDAAEEYERLGRTAAAGNLHRKIARELSARNDPGRAKEHWERARALLETGPETPELARLYDTMGGFLYEEGKPAEAAEMYARAIAIAGRVGDRVTQASAEMVLAALVPVAEKARVFEYLESALGLAREGPARGLLSNIEMVLAMALLQIRGDARGALRRLEDAVEHAREQKDLLTEMGVKGNFIAYADLRLGDLERAERIAEEYAKYAGEDPRKARVTVSTILADVALVRGEFRSAEMLLAESERLLEEGGDWVERAHTEIVLGRLGLRRRRVHSAFEHFATAHRLSGAAGPPALNALFHFEVLDLLVETALAAGAPEESQRYLNELTELADAFGEDLGHAYRRRAEAFWAGHEGNWSAAVDALEKSLEIWKRLGWRYELGVSRSLLAEAYRRLGDARKAEQASDLAQEFLGKLGGAAAFGREFVVDASAPAGVAAPVPGKGPETT